jgi:hypothetical protein
MIDAIMQEIRNETSRCADPTSPDAHVPSYSPSPLRRVSFVAAPSTLANAKNATMALTTRSAGANFHFEEFFCLAMECLHRVWFQRQATYMDFPIIMDEVRSKVDIFA